MKKFYLIWVLMKEKGSWERLLIVDDSYAALMNVLTLKSTGTSAFYVEL